MGLDGKIRYWIVASKYFRISKKEYERLLLLKELDRDAYYAELDTWHDPELESDEMSVTLEAQ